MTAPQAGRTLRPVDPIRRPAYAGDTDAARRIHHQAYRDVVERQFGAWDEAAQDHHFTNGWRSAAFDMLLGEDGDPIGYLSVEHRADDVHVREIVLAPAAQGLGIGTAILRQIIEQADARQVPVRLGTFHANRASRLYVRLGFRAVATTDIHVIFERPPGA